MMRKTLLPQRDAIVSNSPLLEPILKILEVEQKDVPRYKCGTLTHLITRVRREKV